MNHFETIVTFTLPSELAIAKSKLESEGITCRTRDELTVQSYNFLSNSIGGVKLQVEKKDLNKAIGILKQGGFIKEESVEPSNWEKKISNPSFQKRIKFISIAFFSFIGIILIVFVAKFIANRPSDEIRLLQGNWCLEYIEYDEQAYYPNTLIDSEVRIRTFNDCFEHIDFKADGELMIPGFETRPLTGKWALLNGRLNIFNVDTLGFAFEGVYTYSLSNKKLILESDSTRIHCYNPGY